MRANLFRRTDLSLLRKYPEIRASRFDFRAFSFSYAFCMKFMKFFSSPIHSNISKNSLHFLFVYESFLNPLNRLLTERIHTRSALIFADNHAILGSCQIRVCVTNADLRGLRCPGPSLKKHAKMRVKSAPDRKSTRLNSSHAR